VAATDAGERGLRAPRGTFDVLPGEGAPRRELGRIAEELLERAGYGYAETPAFESTELFARGVGEATDIVQKEMFSFEDQGGRPLTLRPEGTAGFCRAYVEHGMHKRPQPVKLWYQGPFFRHEAPQAGRFRQFAQIGAEALGSDDPSLDAESILLLAELLRRAGVGEVRLRLSSLGTAPTRREYAEELRGFLRDREGELSDEVRARLELNPLRAFDSAHAGTRAVLAEAPKLVDRLTPEDAEHFATVRALLDDAGVAYEIDSALVRGLDYYTRTVFEFTSDALGAQSGVGGGGRYDGLVERLGGPATPAVGWAAGVERILLAAGGRSTEETTGLSSRVFVMVEDQSAKRDGFSIVRQLWEKDITAEMEQAGRSQKGQLKHAIRLRAMVVVAIDRNGVMRVEDMRNRTQHLATDVADAVAEASRIAKPPPRSMRRA
jgi:histidyl-tRNA synthetase